MHTSNMFRLKFNNANRCLFSNNQSLFSDKKCLFSIQTRQTQIESKVFIIKVFQTEFLTFKIQILHTKTESKFYKKYFFLILTLCNQIKMRNRFLKVGPNRFEAIKLFYTINKIVIRKDYD